MPVSPGEPFLIQPLLAYIGPGAGFALLSSFLVVLTTMVLVVFSLLVLPFRMLWRALRRKKRLTPWVKRLVIVGFDGQDPQLTERFMKEGKLPNFSKLAEMGCYRRLRTTFPSLSPTAWSSFATGTNPAKHNIFDFLSRDPRTYLPVLSSAHIGDVERFLKIGKYRIPLRKPELRLLAQVEADLDHPGRARGLEHGAARADHVPAREVPRRAALGDVHAGPARHAGHVLPLHHAARRHEVQGGRHPRGPARGRRPLPDEREGTGERVPRGQARRSRCRWRSRWTARRAGPGSSSNGTAVDAEGEGALGLGHRSPSRPRRASRSAANCRMLVTEMDEHFSLYVTPLNIDPEKPAMPISHPSYYATYLAKRIGPYCTLGLAEDTWALNEGVIDDAAFLKQAYDIDHERERMFFVGARQAAQGHRSRACSTAPTASSTCSGATSRRAIPRRGAATATSTPAPSRPSTARSDELVGKVLARIGEGRPADGASPTTASPPSGAACNLNAWLLAERLPRPQARAATASAEWLRDVDWSQDQRLRARPDRDVPQPQGARGPGDRQAGRGGGAGSKAEIMAALQGLRDTEGGDVAINEAVRHREALPRARTSRTRPTSSSASTRATARPGTAPPASSPGPSSRTTSRRGAATTASTRGWCPACSSASRKIDRADPSLVDIAPTVLRLFGLDPPAHMDGQPALREGRLAA